MKLLQVSRPIAPIFGRKCLVVKSPVRAGNGQFAPLDSVTRAMQEQAEKASEAVWHETSTLAHNAFNSAKQEATFALASARNWKHEHAATHHDNAADSMRKAEADDTAKEHHAKSKSIRKQHRDAAKLHKDIVARMAPRKNVDVEVGTFVSATSKEALVMGRVEDVDDGIVSLKLAVPNDDGVLLLTDCVVQVPADTVKALEGAPVHKEAKLMRWDTAIEFTDGKKGVEVKNGDAVVDFKDVAIEGFASTFESVTPRDRDGDAIAPGAFDDTIGNFMKNPVLLVNHRNAVENIAGSFQKLSVTPKGLAVRAAISNSPALAHVRFLIMEGHLKAFSIGGMFMFGGPDGHLIEKVSLFEISLVAIPANPDALFQSRALRLEDVADATKRFQKRSPATMQKWLGASA